MMQGFPMVRLLVTVCVGEWGWNPVLTSEPHKLLRTRKRLIFWIPIINMKYIQLSLGEGHLVKPAFYKWRSQTLKMLSSRAAEAQKAVYMWGARHGPALMNRMPEMRKEIPSKKEKAEKWLFSFPHSRCEFLYWVMIIFKNSESWYFSPAFTSLSPDSTPFKVPHSPVGQWGLPGSGAPAAVHHSLSPLAPEFPVPLVSPLGNCVFQKLLPWHFLTNRQNLFRDIVLLCTLVQSFCFYNVLFCPASHLILINTPSEIGGKGLLLPFYRKGNWGCPFDSPVLSANIYGSQPHTGPAVLLWHSF